MKRLISLVISLVLILSCGVNVYGAKYSVGDKVEGMFSGTLDAEPIAPTINHLINSITVSAPIINDKELYKEDSFIIGNETNYVSGLIDGYRVVSPNTKITVTMDNSADIDDSSAEPFVSIKLVPFRKGTDGIYHAKVNSEGNFTEYYYTNGKIEERITPEGVKIEQFQWVSDDRNIIRDVHNRYKLCSYINSKSFTLPSYVEIDGDVSTNDSRKDIRYWEYFSEDIIWALVAEWEFGWFRATITDGRAGGVFINADPNEGTYKNNCLFIEFFKVDEDYIEEQLGFSHFYDVSSSDYFAEPVKWGVKNNIVNGTSDTEFSPNDVCTHAHILTFLWRVNGSKDIGKFMPGLDGTEWYAKAASWAYQNHLIINADILSQPCDRLYVVKYLIELKKGKKPSLSECRNSEVSNFIDLDDTQKPLVLWAIRNGITSGVSDIEFAPNMSCTRGQIITFLYRAYEKPLELTEVSYSEDDVKYLIGALYGTGFEVDSKTELACMAWLILNRVDNGSFGDSIKDVVLSDDNFEYDADYPSINACGINLENIARGVLSIWESEKASEYASGRVLPPDYIWFDNNIDSFSFRNDFQRNLIWNYSLPSPYEN